MISRRGYAATSVADIVRSAGLAPPALYWHFNNKRGILTAIMQRGAEDWLAHLPSPNGIAADSPRAKLFAGLAIANERLRRNPNFVRLQVMLSLELGEEDETVMEAIREIRTRARHWIASLIGNAWPSLPDALARKLAARAMVFADGWMIFGVIEPDSEEIDLHWIGIAIADEADAYVARGIAPPRVPARRKAR